MAKVSQFELFREIFVEEKYTWLQPQGSVEECRKNVFESENDIVNSTLNRGRFTLNALSSDEKVVINPFNWVRNFIGIGNVPFFKNKSKESNYPNEEFVQSKTSISRSKMREANKLIKARKKKDDLENFALKQDIITMLKLGAKAGKPEATQKQSVAVKNSTKNKIQKSRSKLDSKITNLNAIQNKNVNVKNSEKDKASWSALGKKITILNSVQKRFVNVENSSNVNVPTTRSKFNQNTTNLNMAQNKNVNDKNSDKIKALITRSKSNKKQFNSKFAQNKNVKDEYESKAPMETSTADDNFDNKSKIPKVSQNSDINNSKKMNGLKQKLNNSYRETDVAAQTQNVKLKNPFASQALIGTSQVGNTLDPLDNTPHTPNALHNKNINVKIRSGKTDVAQSKNVRNPVENQTPVVASAVDDVLNSSGIKHTTPNVQQNNVIDRNSYTNNGPVAGSSVAVVGGNQHQPIKTFGLAPVSAKLNDYDTQYEDIKTEGNSNVNSNRMPTGILRGGYENNRSSKSVSFSEYGQNVYENRDGGNRKCPVHGIISSFPSKCNGNYLIYDEMQKTIDFSAQCTEYSIRQDTGAEKRDSIQLKKK